MSRESLATIQGGIRVDTLMGSAGDDFLEQQEALSAAFGEIRDERFEAEDAHLDRVVERNRDAAAEIEEVFRGGLGEVRRQFRVLEFDARGVLRAIVGDLAGNLLDRGLGSFGGGGLFGLVGDLFQGAFAEGGRVVPDRAALVGEDGPELFVPGRAGTIVPNDTLVGPAINVYQSISIGTGVAPTVRAEMLALLPAFKRETMAALIDAQRRSAGALI